MSAKIHKATDKSIASGKKHKAVSNITKAANGSKGPNIPKDHPRYKAMMIRENIIKGCENKVVAPAGLIAQGRGEAFDYLIGEKTAQFSLDAIEAAACAFLLAEHPVISVNGNVAQIAAKDLVKLSKESGAPLEINLFYRAPGREEAILKVLKEAGAKKVLGVSGKSSVIKELSSDRRIVDPNGILKADMVFVPLEDGDRTQALVKLGKKVVTVDLNPLSRTPKSAHVSIIDNITRVLPLLTAQIKKYKKIKKEELKKIYDSYDNKKTLRDSLQFMSERLFSLSMNSMDEEKHPSFDIKNSLDNKLDGKKIVLCITGSVAAVKSSDLARLLMRHGADVYPVMSNAACKIIHPDLIHWATGRYPVKDLTGNVEHVELAGNTKTKADLVIIAPCTANTIGKIASGIDDTSVTTFATTAIGEKIPLIIVPAMHEPMYRHPLVKQNIEKLISCGIFVLQPRIEEGKAKIPENSEIYKKVLEILSPASACGGNALKGMLKGKKIIVTAGRTVEYIDPVRVITNNSSGKMGVALAEKAAEAGADVTLIAGKITVKPSEKIKVIYTDTAEEMYNAVHKELKTGRYDIFAAAAAVGDWQAEEKSAEKISTHDKDSLVLRLKPTPKIIDSIRAKYPSLYLLIFRAIGDMAESDLLDNAKWRMEKAKADMVAVNDVSKKGAGFETDTNEMFVITSNGRKEKIAMNLKENVAKKIIDILAEDLCRKGILAKDIRAK